MPNIVDRAKDLALAAMRWRERRLSRAYRAVFSPDGGRDRNIEIVLADLREFTRANKSAFDLDPLAMAHRNGRRDVWLRLNRYLNLDDATVQNLVELEDGLQNDDRTAY